MFLLNTHKRFSSSSSSTPSMMNLRPGRVAIKRRSHICHAGLVILLKRPRARASKKFTLPSSIVCTRTQKVKSSPAKKLRISSGDTGAGANLIRATPATTSTRMRTTGAGDRARMFTRGPLLTIKIESYPDAAAPGAAPVVTLLHSHRVYLDILSIVRARECCC